MSQPEKTWWARLWRGLVVDPQGKHYHRLKGAVWLLLYLILHADRNSGTLGRKCRTIARDMGISAWTIRYWMRRLRGAGYIRVNMTGRALTIQILRWRTGLAVAAPRGSPPPLSPAGTHSVGRHAAGKTARRRDTPGAGTAPNESTFTRVILRDDWLGKISPSPAHHGNGGGGTLNREQLLAMDLAEGLDDLPHLARYLTYAHRYPESLLRRLLSEARAVPERDIKRSRAALFEHLLKPHAKWHAKDPGD